MNLTENTPQSLSVYRTHFAFETRMVILLLCSLIKWNGHTGALALLLANGANVHDADAQNLST
jgi:hypothetical protein